MTTRRASVNGVGLPDRLLSTLHNPLGVRLRLRGRMLISSNLKNVPHRLARGINRVFQKSVRLFNVVIRVS